MKQHLTSRVHEATSLWSVAVLQLLKLSRSHKLMLSGNATATYSQQITQGIDKYWNIQRGSEANERTTDSPLKHFNKHVEHLVKKGGRGLELEKADGLLCFGLGRTDGQQGKGGKGGG